MFAAMFFLKNSENRVRKMVEGWKPHLSTLYF